MPENKNSNPSRHLAHDLNNIFTRILNSVDLLKKKTQNYDELAPLLGSIESGTYMAAEIIEDFISDSPGKSLKKKRICINSLITELLNTIGVPIKERIHFDLKLEPELNNVEARYSDLYRVLLNLIVNAFEAVNGKGIISISTSNIRSQKKQGAEPKLFENQSFIQLTISDNGEGIDSSILPLIFDEKFTTKSKKKNSGIGLSIVKKIVEDYGGTIKVSSEKGKGTDFIITLPALYQIDKDSGYSSKKTKLILIAEDEEILRQLLSELLESYNYKVISASNGKDVLEELKSKSKPDILIIDQKMPDMDGLTCILKIKELKLKIPIILASGSQGSIANEENLVRLADKVINKPYNFDEMLSTIKELVG